MSVAAVVAAGVRVASNQVQYSVLDRRCEARLVPLCAEHGATLLCYGEDGTGRDQALFGSDALVSKAVSRVLSAGALQPGNQLFIGVTLIAMELLVRTRVR